MNTFEELIDWYYARPPHKRISPQFIPRDEWEMLREFADSQGKEPIRGALLLLGTEFMPEVKLTREPAARPWGSWGRQAGDMLDGNWRESGIA